MNAKSRPGECPHYPPVKSEQRRIQTFAPYVRQAEETMRPTWIMKPRKIPDFLLVNWIDGTGEMRIGGDLFPLQNGDLIWIPPDTLHEMRGDAPGTLMQFIHFDIYYDPARSHWNAQIPGQTPDISLWKNCIHPPAADPVIKQWKGPLHHGNRTLVTEIMRRIILEYNRTQTSTLLISGLLNQLLGHLLDSHSQESAGIDRHSRSIENAMQYIQLHSHEKLNINALARRHGLSPTHFRKLFREHYRQNPRTAHLKAKLRQATDYLLYSDLTISEIADRLGFTNVHNFSRAFRNITGRAPSTYRNAEKSAIDN